jgi:hypothetical protein
MIRVENFIQDGEWITHSNLLANKFYRVKCGQYVWVNHSLIVRLLENKFYRIKCGQYVWVDHSLICKILCNE